jgi:hypothetical protein
MMMRIMMLVTAAGRMLAADGGPICGSRYARRLLVLSATLTAAMVVGLLAFATSVRADVVCQFNHCLEKTVSSEDPVKVGEPLTFTIREFCTLTPPLVACESSFSELGLTDTLPAGVEFVSATATGYGGTELFPRPQPTCSESAGAVTCAPLSYRFSTIPGSETESPFVATIEVIPTQCGTFTNTASSPTGRTVSETFTVVGCPPPSKEQCKEGGYEQFGFENQGRCIKAVKQES